MTAHELIKALQDLGEENLDKEVCMFDGSAWYTPYKDKSWGIYKEKNND